MRRLLYITPYFPPQTKVGALRPLKFVRHLRAFGWDPIVLCDQRPSDRTDPDLDRALPPALKVVRDYSFLGRHSALRHQLSRWFFPASDAPSSTGHTPPSPSRQKRWPSPNPEWFPLGGHVFDAGHAIRAGRKILKNNDCSAILVNADPYASLLVGQRLAQEFSLPWVADLRDPWSVCELRRPQRPRLQRAWVDKTERGLIEGSAAYIVNTERTRADYRAHFSGLDPQKFHCVRNHVDLELFDSRFTHRWSGFSLLFFGTFRRFLGADPIIRSLSRLKAKGTLPATLRLHVVGQVPRSERQLMAEAGIQGHLEIHAPLSYLKAQAMLRTADVLLSLGHATAQRIPAKIYDYLASGRPIIHAGSENPELEGMLARATGADFCPSGYPEELDRVLLAHIESGRKPDVRRSLDEFTSHTATRKLAGILDQTVERWPDVTSGG